MKIQPLKTKGEWEIYISCLYELRQSIYDDLTMQIKRYEDTIKFIVFDKDGKVIK